MTAPFRGGVHPHDFKSFTESRRIEDFGVPSKVVLMMNQHLGAPAEVVGQNAHRPARTTPAARTARR